MYSNDFESNPVYGEIEEIIDEVEKKFKKFKKFDIVSDTPFDHHFLDYKRPIRRNLLAEKVQQEWRTLETSLPNSILARAYENRIDLMRAVVIGPPGTPYYHGLFFFDILFPSNYPNRPPKLFYRSQGLDLNPNLRPEGRVYLSLVENWYGRLVHGSFGSNVEKWKPEESNVLQVLISIQRLVLNSKPYPNNKNAFMLTCEAMTRWLQAPPRHFEDFVAGHFRLRSHQILMNYREYTDQSECMVQLFLKLVNALEANGSYCKHHLSQVIIEKENTEERDTNNEIVAVFFGKLKNVAVLLA
ncbi:phosphate 2 [Actinidia rufa]|uniref:Phosphate 2 n=1 Tax=Actinidia rufa TaxID=165716 RepID=A0A7J0G0Y3_9ERIC|nr:phosphate 2 [Actinidia rufa]